MKIIDFIKKNYIYLSITALGLGIYIILFPVISDFLNRFSETLTQCAYLKITGKNCPLCGGTRYIRNLSNVFEDVTYLFHPFGIMVLCVIFEIIFRIYCLYKIRKKAVTNQLIKFDIMIHSIMVIAFVLYEIIFMIQNS